jgi:hypothetical protein
MLERCSKISSLQMVMLNEMCFLHDEVKAIEAKSEIEKIKKEDLVKKTYTQIQAMKVFSEICDSTQNSVIEYEMAKNGNWN